MLQLLRWQWEGYPRYHQARANLLLHIIAVPVFLVANVALVVAVVQRSWTVALLTLVTMLVAIVAQGRGHRWERVPPEPFTSFGNGLTRLFCEQWVTFPRFVFSGRWRRALHGAL